MKKTVIFLFIAILLCSASAWAEPIYVNVNGTQVLFGEVGPMQYNGRVLVPLRGVLEQMGVYVGWDAPNRTVIAERGDVSVSLPIGSRIAVVNGRTVTLDVPAMIMSGTTMVPLRFLAEAMGASVRWEPVISTVVIETGENIAPTLPEEFEIDSFYHNAAGWLKSGNTLTVIMLGTSGGQAYFEIPGVIPQTRMTEINDGEYKGVWTVPMNTKSISGASLVGLLKMGTAEKLIQAENPIDIDVTPPTIKNHTPAPDTLVSVSKQAVSAILDDGTGSGIDTESAVLRLNGVNVTQQAVITPSFISYKPETPLPSQNTVTLSVSDLAGNKANANWKFGTTEHADTIESFTFETPPSPSPGDVISVQMKATTGGQASFSLVSPAGTTLRRIPMIETTPGTYTGEYTVRKGDILTGVAITGELKLENSIFRIQAAGTIDGTVTGTIAAPVIKSPQENAEVVSPLVVTGTAVPGSKVKISIEYVTLLLGALPLSGILPEQTVTVDSKGQFTSEPIDLGTLGKSKDTGYTLTAVTIGAAGQESTPIQVLFKGK